MKVNNINKILRVYESQNIKDVDRIKNNKKKDELSLSRKAKEYQDAIKKLNQVPDIRKDKVKEIKEQIETGTYKIDGKEIVDKIFERAKFNRRI